VASPAVAGDEVKPIVPAASLPACGSDINARSMYVTGLLLLLLLPGALTHLGLNCTVEGDARSLPSCEFNSHVATCIYCYAGPY
jgi:hypothetical protein